MVRGTLFLYYILRFRLQESFEKVDVFASEVAKMLPGSNFPKISKA